MNISINTVLKEREIALALALCCLPFCISGIEAEYNVLVFFFFFPL